MKQEFTLSILYHLLGHAGMGCTVLYVLSPTPMVAYADSEPEFTCLCQEMEQKGFSVHVKIQPQPIYLFDVAPNQWMQINKDTSKKNTPENETEYITMTHIQIGFCIPDQKPSAIQRERGYQEALAIANQPELKCYAVIVTAESSYHILIPLCPIQVDKMESDRQYNYFWQSFLSRVVRRVDKSISVTSAFHIDDTMPVIHGDYQETSQENKLSPAKKLGIDRSYELHQSILNTGVSRTDLQYRSAASIRIKKRKPIKTEKSQMLLWPNL